MPSFRNSFYSTDVFVDINKKSFILRIVIEIWSLYHFIKHNTNIQYNSMLYYTKEIEIICVHNGTQFYCPIFEQFN